MKPSRPKDPGKVKGDGIKAAQAPQGKKPSKVTDMKAAKKKER